MKVVEDFPVPKQSRVSKPDRYPTRLSRRRKEWLKEFQVPIVVELILERVTNVAMGNEINAITEFEDVVDLPPEIEAEAEAAFA